MSDSVYLVEPTSGWVFEDGTEFDREHAPDIYHAPVIENKELDTLWYSQYFASQEHQNYLGIDENYGPFALSVKKEESNKQYRAILWLSEGAQTLLIPLKEAKQTIGPSDILKKMNPNLRKKLRVVTDPEIQKELISLEEQTRAKRYYSFGVLYARDGQTREEEMFRNRTGSSEFDKFLSLLGDKVTLKGWNRFAGGLDQKSDRSGKYSIFTQFSDYEIMFHVSTLLPFEESDPQQIERKKHIGNDIVVIIFQDSDSKTPWDPLTISSRFNHIYAVVRPMPGGYKVNISRRETVNPYGPPLPKPPVFEEHVFKTFLLAKLINGERETIRSVPDFKTSSISQSYLATIYRNFYQTAGKIKKGLASSASMPGSTNNSPPTQQLRFSDHMNLTRSDSGGALLFQSQNAVFTVKQMFENFDKEILCANTWENRIVYGTTDGLYIFDPTRGATIDRQIYQVNTRTQKYTHYLQMNIIPQLGILVALTAKAGIFIYDLNSMQDEVNGPHEFRVPKTKNVHYYTLGSFANEPSLFLCCCSGKEIHLYRWENDAFVRVQTFVMPDVPKVVDFWGESLIVGLPREYALLDVNSSTLLSLYQCKGNDMTPLDVVTLESELFLCFNNMGVFITADGKKSRAYDIVWGAVPHQFVNVFPYILAFTPKCIEVRSMVNGSLIQTIILDKQTDHIQFLTSMNGLFFSIKVSQPQAVKSTSSALYQLRLQGPPPNRRSKSPTSSLTINTRTLKRRTISSPTLAAALKEQELAEQRGVLPGIRERKSERELVPEPSPKMISTSRSADNSNSEKDSNSETDLAARFLIARKTHGRKPSSSKPQIGQRSSSAESRDSMLSSSNQNNNSPSSTMEE
jgi:hypothetical protein